MRAALAVLALVLLWQPAVAEAPRFRHERPVMPAGPGAGRLAVDVPLLAGARPLRYDPAGRFVGGLDDLRLFATTGAEVPHLVVAPSEPREEWRDGRLVPVLATDDESGFEVDLGAATTVDRLRLTGLSAPFLKRVRLEGSGDRNHWALLAAEATVFDLPAEQLRRFDIDFAPEDVRYLRVTWDDRSSARLPAPQVAAARVATAVTPPAPERVPLPFEARPSEPGKSRFRLRLPAVGMPLRALELDCPGEHLLRPAYVAEARLDGGEVTPHELGQAVLRRTARGGLVAADLRIPIATPSEPELELVVDDGDNPPLDLRGVWAELAPLPWIYFESPDGATLVARFGDAKIAAPRYDLEAARAAVAGTTPPGARWGETVATAQPEPPPPDAAAAVPAVGAPVDPKMFRFARPLPDGPTGLTAVALDAAVLAHSRALADVRVVDGEGRQVPYVVEHLDEPLEMTLAELVPIAGTTHGESRYRLTLPYANLPVARLVLTTTARVFERRVALRVEQAGPDARTPAREQTVAQATWLHADPDASAPALTILVPSLDTSTVTVAIDDGDNSRLPVAPPRLLLPARRVRLFRVSDEPLRLLYGAPGLSAPRYDLALLAPRVLGASANEIAPAPETGAGEAPASAAGGTATERRVFWAALALAVAVLLGVLARLLRDAGAPGEAKP
ncbi:MAG TPA: DUF3999 family protein [Candidatus Binatia bacterium]|nr:DUF3999 family protein [Candidatus Binatia bacterium]